MKQNNFDHLAIFDAAPNGVVRERLRARHEENRQRHFVSYSSVAAVTVSALLSVALILPNIAKKGHDDEIYALNAGQVQPTAVASTTVKESLSKLSDENKLFADYGKESFTRSDSEQERALLSLLNSEHKSEEVLKVKEAPAAITPSKSSKTGEQGSNLQKKAAVSKSEPKAQVTRVAATGKLAVTTGKLPQTVLPKAAIHLTTGQLPVESAAQAPKSANAERAADSAASTATDDDFAQELTDTQLMYYIVMAETGYTDETSISLVAQIIVNRTRYLHQSLRAVLTAPDQFTCYENGSYKRYAPTEKVKRICDAALAGRPTGGYVLPHDVIYYCTVNYYKTGPSFFKHSLKQIVWHASQVFFAPAGSSTPVIKKLELPEDNAQSENDKPQLQPQPEKKREPVRINQPDETPTPVIRKP